MSSHQNERENERTKAKMINAAGLTNCNWISMIVRERERERETGSIEMNERQKETMGKLSGSLLSHRVVVQQR